MAEQRWVHSSQAHMICQLLCLGSGTYTDLVCRGQATLPLRTLKLEWPLLSTQP